MMYGNKSDRKKKKVTKYAGSRGRPTKTRKGPPRASRKGRRSGGASPRY